MIHYYHRVRSSWRGHQVESRAARPEAGRLEVGVVGVGRCPERGALIAKECLRACFPARQTAQRTQSTLDGDCGGGVRVRVLLHRASPSGLHVFPFFCLFECPTRWAEMPSTKVVPSSASVAVLYASALSVRRESSAGRVHAKWMHAAHRGD